ncbi:MAG: PspC domain-containing protein [Candidatus Caldarchaeum sp.]|nr:PspC domain-containing protein [Candidatus Caldarchaeum sp.]
MSARVLERSDRNRVLAGVFGGLGEYLNVDANLLRLVGVVLLIVSPVLMVILYTLAVFLIPRRGGISYLVPSVDVSKVGPAIVGLVLVVVGVGMFSAWPMSILGFLPSFSLALNALVGIVLTVVGVVLLVNHLRKM